METKPNNAPNPYSEVDCKYKQNLTHVFKLSDLPSERYGGGGAIKLATKTAFPILKGIAVFWISLDKDGIALPHWHPNTDELSYCISGKGRMSIVGPNNDKETKEFGPGDLIFFPRGHFHYIESIGEETLQFLAIFNNELPDFIGINGAIAGIPEEALANTFKVPAEVFKKFETADTILTSKSKSDEKKTT